MRKVVLISCVKRKQPFPAPARDLYVSAYFRKARAYAEAFGDAWFILSAKHGLVAPDEVTAPYDLAQAEGRNWGWLSPFVWAGTWVPRNTAAVQQDITLMFRQPHPFG